MKEDNLIPQAHKLTVEEASKGGKKSVQSRRERKELKRVLEMLLEKEYVDKKGNSKTGAELIAIKQYEKALIGDTRAFEVVRDTAGQKPVEKIMVAEVEQNIIDEVEQMGMGDE